MKSDEDIMVFYKKQPTYNPQMTIGTKYKGRNNTDNHKKLKGEWMIGQGNRSDNKGTRYPRTNIYFANENKKGQHPTQKPVALFEYLIKTYTNEGELILDNCAGSGTTGEACFNTGRNYIQIEKEQDYFSLILGREKSFNKKDLYDGTLFETQM